MPDRHGTDDEDESYFPTEKMDAAMGALLDRHEPDWWDVRVDGGITGETVVRLGRGDVTWDYSFDVNGETELVEMTGGEFAVPVCEDCGQPVRYEDEMEGYCHVRSSAQVACPRTAMPKGRWVQVRVIDSALEPGDAL